MEAAKRFYGNVFGFKQVPAEPDKRSESCHLTDGTFDLLLMARDRNNAENAQHHGSGSRLHHWGIEVDGRAAYAENIAMRGGTILSKPESPSIEFRAPDGTLAGSPPAAPKRKLTLGP